MRRRYKLLVDGVEYKISNYHLVFELNAVARGFFVCIGDTGNSRRTENGYNPIWGKVEFWAGDENEIYPVFLGYVINSESILSGEIKFVCRQKVGVLDIECKISERHLTSLEILKIIADKASISFSYSTNSLYLKDRIANFISIGTAREALDSLIKIWEKSTTEIVWFQEPNQKIYVGSWRDSLFSKMDSIQIDRFLLNKNYKLRSFEIPLIPPLMAGMRIEENSEKYIIQKMEWKENKSHLFWKKENV